jgi:fibronectin type 3 domain-containing protein
MTDKPKVAAQQYDVYTGTEPTFIDTDIVVGQTYLYRVFAGNGCGKAELSPQTEGKATKERPLDRSRLNPPTWIEATRGRPYDKVQVAWRAASGAASYRILRATAYAGPYERLAETASTTYEDRDVILCGDYWYRIQSLVGRTESEPSVTVYGSYGYRPEAPQNVRASVGTYANSIEITWSPMADAQMYHLSRAPEREGPYAVIAEGQRETSYVDEGLVPGQGFWYKVKAANACGCSGDLGPAYGATTPK